MAVVTRRLTLNVDVATERRDGYWVATSDPLYLAVYGSTEEEAKQRLMEAVGFHLTGLAKHGRLPQYLSGNAIPHVITDDPPRRTKENRSFTQELEELAGAAV